MPRARYPRAPASSPRRQRDREHAIDSDRPRAPVALLPPKITVPVVLLCALPLVLKLVGVDLGSAPPPRDAGGLALLSGDELSMALHRALRGAFVHALLDWTAVLLALVTGVLALGLYRLRRQTVTAVVGLAMFGAGLMDAFHTLAAHRLILPNAVTGDYVSFSWAVSRFYQAGMLLLGTATFVVLPKLGRRASAWGLTLVGLGFGGAAWVLINVLVATEKIPPMVYPGALFPRPWDILPMMFFGIAGVSVLPRLHRALPSVFTHALLFSSIPNVTAELHMALGSHSLLDHDHNAAHALRVLAYAVIAVGIAVDYLDQHRRVQRQSLELTAGVAAIGMLNQDLRRTVAELEQFAYAASHDLKAPLRGISSICAWLEEDLADGNTADFPEHLALMRRRVRRMERLLADLRAWSRVGRVESQVREVDLGELVDGVIELVAPPEGFVIERQAELPRLRTAAGALEQVLLNLFTNAVKHHDRDSGHVWLRCKRRGDGLDFEVADDGPGIPAEYRDKALQVFKTLRPRDEVEGSGMGLAITKKIVEGAGGRIEIGDNEPRGAVFRFRWPLTWPQRSAP